MRKNIYNSNILRLVYKPSPDKKDFQLIKNNSEYGRKYTLDQAYDLATTINIAKEEGKYDGSFNIEFEVEKKLRDYEQERNTKRNQNIESLISSS